MDTQPNGKIVIIKNIYFYLVSFVALMMVVFSLADLINLGLKTWVFPKADDFSYAVKPYGCEAGFKPADPNYKAPTAEECAKQEADAKKQEEESRTAQRQRDAVRDISMIVVGIPLFILHWLALRKKETA